MYRYFKRIAGVGSGDYIYYWKSKGLSDEIINSIETPNYSITPNLDYYGTKTRVKFNGSCLKQDSITFNHKKVVKIYIVYELTNYNDSTLRNSLFGAVTLTKKLISIGTNILDMELDLISMEFCHFQVADLAAM